MSTPLDLEEQEQLDDLKHFWKQYGNFITWFLIVVMGTYAGWNGYQYWQKQQSAKAAALFDEVERAALSGVLEHAARRTAANTEIHKTPRLKKEVPRLTCASIIWKHPSYFRDRHPKHSISKGPDDGIHCFFPAWTMILYKLSRHPEICFGP